MAQQTINFSPAFSPTDDTLPVGAAKINSNFNELYSLQSKTLNAADQRFAASTIEGQISNAINLPGIGGIAVGAQVIYIPAFMLPYDASQIPNLGTWGGRIVREGGEFDVYDMLAYGVRLGDLTIGATASYNAAVSAALAAGGGTIYFPPGSYYFMTSPTTLTGVLGITLQGAGRNASFLVMGVDGVTVISLGISATRFFVRDLWIGRFASMANCTTGGGFSAIAPGYPLTPVSELLIDNVTLQNLPYPVYFDNVAGAGFFNLRYVQSQAGATVGDVFYMIRSVGIKLVQDDIFTTVGTLPRDAMRIDSDCDTILLDQCEHVLLGNGANTNGFHVMDSVGGHPPRIIRITDCDAENGQVGFRVDAARDCRINTFECANNNAQGVFITGGISVGITNGQVFLNGTHGIHAQGGSGILIEGNTCSNNSQAANNTSDGIVVQTSDVRCVNNRSGDIFFTNPNKQRFGLNITAGIDHLVIGGNKLQGNLGSGFEQPMTVAATGSNIVFFGHTVNNTTRAVLVAGYDGHGFTGAGHCAIRATADQNFIVAAPSNPVVGQRLTFTIIQNGTGGWTVGWNAVFKQSWSDAGNTLNKRSTIAYVYDGTSWNQDGAQTPYV